MALARWRATASSSNGAASRSDHADGSLGTLPQAGAQAVAERVGHQPGLAIHQPMAPSAQEGTHSPHPSHLASSISTTTLRMRPCCHGLPPPVDPIRDEVR